MKNITKKTLILTSLLVFSCSNNFCMQNNHEITKDPNKKWKVIVIKKWKEKKIPSRSIETKIVQQVVNIKTEKKSKEYELADQTDRFREKRILFSPNGRYVGFKTLIPKYIDYFGELIILDLENNFEEIVPFDKKENQFDKKENQFTLQYFIFGPNSRYIAAIMYIDNGVSGEHSYDTARIFDLELRKDITKEMDKDFYEKNQDQIMFNADGKYLLIREKILDIINVYNIISKKKQAIIVESKLYEFKYERRYYDCEYEYYGFVLTGISLPIISNKYMARKIKQGKEIEITDITTGKKYMLGFDKIVKKFDLTNNEMLEVELEDKTIKTINCSKQKFEHTKEHISYLKRIEK